MRLLCMGILLVFLGACNNDSVVQIRINSLLHDDSSKVWMVESEQVDGKENAPENTNFRTIITFYRDLKFTEQPLNTIGNKPPKYGSFEVGAQNEILTFTMNKRKNDFKVKEYSKERIVLHSVDQGKIKLVLIPLPQL
jgi:hypothetical protein